MCAFSESIWKPWTESKAESVFLNKVYQTAICQHTLLGSKVIVSRLYVEESVS